MTDEKTKKYIERITPLSHPWPNTSYEDGFIAALNLVLAHLG